jgi:hypothetical protein
MLAVLIQIGENCCARSGPGGFWNRRLSFEFACILCPDEYASGGLQDLTAEVTFELPAKLKINNPCSFCFRYLDAFNFGAWSRRYGQLDG